MAPLPDSISVAQLVAIMEDLGFYQEREDDPWFMNSDSKRRHGPGGIYVDLGTATSFPLGIIRLYLQQQNIRPQRLDEAIRRVLGA